jgi:hypothetical protein
MGSTLTADVFYGFPVNFGEDEDGYEIEPPWEEIENDFADDFEYWFAYIHDIIHPGFTDENEEDRDSFYDAKNELFKTFPIEYVTYSWGDDCLPSAIIIKESQIRSSDGEIKPFEVGAIHRPLDGLVEWNALLKYVADKLGIEDPKIGWHLSGSFG